jgi:hypothetical protein
MLLRKLHARIDAQVLNKAKGREQLGITQRHCVALDPALMKEVLSNPHAKLEG